MPLTTTATRLEIGPGQDRRGEDWVTVSAVPSSAVDFLAEWGEDRLPFPDESMDEVYASHVLEHVPYWKTEAALVEAWRVLRRGGTIEIHTVDVAQIMASWESRVPVDDWEPPYGDGGYMHWLAGRLFAYGAHRADPNWHKAVFDEGWLRVCLTRAGFTECERLEHPDGLHGVINLGMKAVKR